ncbi:4Fe-4S binding protein [Candidatus Sumerlaeota bacterium]|nr:4Fe-4S binding protein [Candidatus Sumerlaeota bacterium]
MRLKPRIWLAAGTMALLGMAWAAEQRFPKPDFESGYNFPQYQHAAPAPWFYEFLDAAVLLGALSLGTYFVLKKRTRRGMLGLTIFSLLYFGFYKQGCICAIGAIQNMSLALFDPEYAVSYGTLIVFLAPLFFALLFGRIYCGGVCPLGAIQDLFALKPIAVPRWIDRALGVFPYIYLGAAVLFAATRADFIICRFDPFVPLFRLTGHWQTLWLGAGFLLVGVFIARPYCRYFCPYGVLLGWMSRLSKWHMSIAPERCTLCRLCENSCPFGAINTPTQPPREPRAHGVRRLAMLFALIPALLIGGGAIGWFAGGPLSRAHRTVALAERVAVEDAGWVEGSTNASDAFRMSGATKQELLADARSLRQAFRIGGAGAGAFAGLAFGLLILGSSVHRTRDEYNVDRATCFSCARCIPYCPEDPSSKILQEKQCL